MDYFLRCWVQDLRWEGQAYLSFPSGYGVQAEPAASGVQDIITVVVEMNPSLAPQVV